jgi:hypothetical protein
LKYTGKNSGMNFRPFQSGIEKELSGAFLVKLFL